MADIVMDVITGGDDSDNELEELSNKVKALGDDLNNKIDTLSVQVNRFRPVT